MYPPIIAIKLPFSTLTLTSFKANLSIYGSSSLSSLSSLTSLTSLSSLISSFSSFSTFSSFLSLPSLSFSGFFLPSLFQ